MADFVQQLQEHANNVCNILQEEIEWIERYKGYVDILSTLEDKPLGFRSPGELFPYITLSVAKQNCSVSERGKSKYFLRYLGQNVADILVSNKTGMRLCVLHNLYFYNTMMEEIRDALDAGRFHEYKAEKLYNMSQGQK